MKCVYVLTVCSFLFLVISIGLVVYLLCIGKNCDIKNISFGDASVTVLCTIVGLLVGWNIYSTIDLKNIKTGLEDVKSESKINSYKTSATVFSSMADFYQRNNDVNNVFYYNVLTLASVSKYGNMELVNTLISALIQSGYPNHLSFYEDTKNYMIGLLYECAHEMPKLKYDINKIVDIINKSSITHPSEIGV